jgi:hypothetical protein
MTEAEWLACADPERMLNFLGEQASKRKRRLFEVACCRRIGHLLVHEVSRETVDVTERNADGLAGEVALVATRKKAEAVYSALIDQASNGYEHEKSWEPVRITVGGVCVDGRAAVVAAVEVCGYDGEDGTEWSAHRIGMFAAQAIAWDRSADRFLHEETEQKERAVQAALLRDLCGNPFFPVRVDPAWRTGTVAALAETLYDDRAFDRLPILADALEDAGCTDPAILDHCRGPGPHVRGCWVVDLILGKS